MPRRLASTAALMIGLLAFSARPTPAPDASPQASPAVREAYNTVTNDLLCYCGCARQTLRDCTCGVAFGLRDRFEARLAAGESAESIIASYIAEHGEQARNSPPKSGLNLLAWWGPGIAILTAGLVTLIVISVWASRAKRASAVSKAPPAPGDLEIRERFERELEKFEM